MKRKRSQMPPELDAACAVATRKLQAAREALDAAREDVRENGRPHAGPAVADAWTLFGNARRQVVHAQELGRALGWTVPGRLERECSDVWDALSSMDLVYL